MKLLKLSWIQRIAVGVFAFGLASGKNPEDAMKLGIKVASMSVTRKGAQSSYPSQAEIETLS